MKKSLYSLLMLPLLFVACTQQPAAPPAAPAPAAPEYKPHGNLAQMMRSIAFPNSNIIFDAQSNDPEARKTAAKAASEKGGDAYAGTYGGWSGVEESAVALGETANLLLIPGRVCSNGVPAPVDRDDWKKAVQGLRDASDAAVKAAQSKNMDNIVDVSGTITDACAACHMTYRDQPEPKPRCTP
jgi:hypothetical protein